MLTMRRGDRVRIDHVAERETEREGQRIRLVSVLLHEGEPLVLRRQFDLRLLLGLQIFGHVSLLDLSPIATLSW